MEGEPGLAPPRRWRPGVLLAVVVGGAVGGLARAGLAQALPTRPGHLPWSVFAINVSGAFVIGALLAAAPLLKPGRVRLRALTTTGFCGGFTTWSTFMVGTDQLLARGHPGAAFSYLFGTVTAGLLAATVGAGLVERLSARRPVA